MEMTAVDAEGVMGNYAPPKDLTLMALGDFLHDAAGNRYADFQAA